MKNNVYEKVAFNCVGCGLCETICPKKCIKLNEVSNRGIIPCVDYKKCTNCGLCIDYCSVDLIEEKEDLNKIKHVFIGKSKDKDIIKNSASGGVVSSILIDLFRKKEIDAAIVAFVDEGLNIYGDFITSESEVLKHSGSFYHTSNMLKNVKKIKNYKSILFVGLPCQNVIFDRFINKYNINNVYAKISLTCTIGRMKNGMVEYLKEKNFQLNGNTQILKYKSRYGVERPGDIIIESEEEKIEFSSEDYLVSKDYFYMPEGCLRCKKLFGVDYADISVGDNWGIQSRDKIAIFTANTERGLEILKNNTLIEMSISTLDELKKSQPLGYSLKYNDRKLINKKIKCLKYLYRIFPKDYLFMKVLHILRGIILAEIKKRQQIKNKNF